VTYHFWRVDSRKGSDCRNHSAKHVAQLLGNALFACYWPHTQNFHVGPAINNTQNAEDNNHNRHCLPLHNDPCATVGALTNLSSLAAKRGLYGEARAHGVEALQLARQMGIPRAIATQLTNMGAFDFHLGNYNSAEKFLQQALELADQHDYGDVVVFARANLGEIYTHFGQYKEATFYLEAGLSLTRQSQHRRAEGNLLDLLGAVALAQGNWEASESCFVQSLQIARELKYQERLGSVLVRQGILRGRSGGSRAQAGGNRETLITARLGLAELYEIDSKDDLSDQIEMHLNAALTLAREISGGIFLMRALINWGEWQRTRAMLADAQAILEEAFTLAEKTGCRAEAALTRFGLARLALEENSREVAQSMGEESHKVLQAIGHYRAAAVEAWLSSTNR